MIDRFARVRRRLPLAALLAVLPLAACDSDPAPPFQVQGTGSVEGLVFFDADRNGVFDPSAGDSALTGVRVLVRERGTQQTLAGGTATTGATGRFVISSLVPGTHDLVVDTASASGVRFCQNPLPVSVFIGERQFANVSGRRACIISIAEAERTRNQAVVVQGIITSAPGETRSQYTYIQDETGGIRVFSSVPEGKGLAIGDRIEVTGTVTTFRQDLQLGGTVVLGAIQKNAFQIQPEELTTKRLEAAADTAESRLLGILISLRKVSLVSAFGANGADGRNAVINDGSGPAQIRVEAAIVPGTAGEAMVVLNNRFAVGKCYDITGVTGTSNGDGQIFPRSFADIREVPCQ